MLLGILFPLISNQLCQIVVTIVAVEVPGKERHNVKQVGVIHFEGNVAMQASQMRCDRRYLTRIDSLIPRLDPTGVPFREDRTFQHDRVAGQESVESTTPGVPVNVEHVLVLVCLVPTERSLKVKQVAHSLTTAVLFAALSGFASEREIDVSIHEFRR